MPPRHLRFLLAEGALLAAAAAAGGAPAIAVAAVALVAIACSDLRPAAVAGAAPAVLWLLAARGTGNRELFFPYAMQLATHALALAAAAAAGGAEGSRRGAAGRGALAGGAVVAAFLGVRAMQQATPRVLGVEAAVAGAILALALAAALATAGRSAAPLIGAGGALAALAGLAL